MKLNFKIAIVSLKAYNSMDKELRELCTEKKVVDFIKRAKLACETIPTQEAK